MRRALALAMLLVAHPAFADDPPAEAPAPADEPTAADADGAPLPGQESGRTDRPEGDSTLRNIGQGVLAVPRIAVVTALAPVRAGIWMYDRYRLSDRFARAFFDRTRTYGLYPTATVDSVYGINLGARIVHRDVFGEREKVSLRGTSGGQFRTLIDGSVTSGRRLGTRTMLQFRGEFERRPEDRYFGIGNQDGAIEVRYREELRRASTSLDVRATSHLLVRATGSLTDREYDNATIGPPIMETYGPSMLTGIGGVRNLYGELELRWDGRNRENAFNRFHVYDTGFFFSGFLGRVHQLQAGDNYWRYGGSTQHFVGLFGPRAIMTRVHVEAVTGDLFNVAFNQLPALGGPQLLRGYAPTRFRDRGAVVGTLEYFWDIGPLFMASLFVDAGRVYPSLGDLSPDDLRVGYGASVQLHGGRRFLTAINVASSIDGGVFVNMTFDPIFDHDPRAERR